MHIREASGGVAQLGERHVRNVEAVGSIPIASTDLIFYIGEKRDFWGLVKNVQMLGARRPARKRTLMVR